MTAHFFVSLAALSQLPVSTSILFDLLGGLAPHPTCICAPPPCAAAASATSQSISSATGVASGQFVGQPYGGGPPYAGAGPPIGPIYGGQPYGGFPYRGRSKRAVEEPEAFWNESCSSETVGTIIEQSMTSSIYESRELILRSLLNHYGRDVLVVCAPHPLDFSFTTGVEFCSIMGDNITCHGFVF